MARAIDGTWDSFLLNLSYLTLKDFQENKAGLNTLKTAVESQPTLTPPNEPLTPKQLREMNEPVWCSCKPIEGGNGYWCLCRYGKIVTPSGNIFDVDKIPHWMFYRRPPEGEEDA